MSPSSAPKPTTELFAESYRLSPKQREVLDALGDFPQGARAADIASALNMHVNTARGHLDELLAQNAVRVVTATPEGRGRPSLIFFTRVPDNRAVAHEYVSLIELMAHMLNDAPGTDTSSVSTAREIGARWAQRLNLGIRRGGDVEEVLSALILRLRQMGFDPSVPEDAAAISLNSCPFVIDGERPSRFICAVHEGLIQEILGPSNEVHLELLPLNAPGTCTLHLKHS